MFSKVKNWDYINLLCSGEQTSSNLQGFVITNDDNVRTKIRNIEYEKIKRMRGNSPKLQYQFLELYKTNKVNNYLNYFPEHRELFSQFQKDFYKWTEKYDGPEAQITVKWNDPTLKIPWPLKNPILSERDNRAGFLEAQ